jgi:hypothetical protein
MRCAELRASGDPWGREPQSVLDCMSKRRYRLDSQLLTLSFFVAMPLVAFSSFVVVSMARSTLQDAAGRELEQRALQTRFLIEHFIGDQIVQLRLLATDPAVVAAARAPHPVVSIEQRRRTERAWASGSDPRLLQPFLASAVAPRLRQAAALVPSLRVLQIFDADGRLLATTVRAGHVFQDDATWYRQLQQDPLAGAFVGETQRTSPGGPPHFEIAYSIVDPVTGRWLGAVRGVVRAADLYGVLASVRIGQTGHALLIRAGDGLVVAADEAERAPSATFPGFDAIRAAMQARRGYWIVPRLRAAKESGHEAGAAPARLVGYAVVEQVPGVSWIVVVEQEIGEATEPINGITRYLWLHFLGALVTVFLLALYLSLRQETPVIAEGLHLHETHVPPSMHRPDENGPPANTQGPLSVR